MPTKENDLHKPSDTRKSIEQAMIDKGVPKDEAKAAAARIMSASEIELIAMLYLARGMMVGEKLPRSTEG